jgi:hypothetical protein
MNGTIQTMSTYFSSANGGPKRRSQYLVKLIYMCLSVIVDDHDRFSKLLLDLIVDQSEIGIKSFDCKSLSTTATPPAAVLQPLSTSA